MTAVEKVKQLILFRVFGIVYTSPESINAKWTEVEENDDDDFLDEIKEKINEVRYSIETIDTDIPPDECHYFESKSVAMQMLDGSWVGWTYYYGGGKHARPEVIEWIEDAYDVDCEVVMKPVFVFKKKESVDIALKNSSEGKK